MVGKGLGVLIFLMSNKMSQNPEIPIPNPYKQPPSRPAKVLTRGNEQSKRNAQSKRRLRSMKNYHLWKQKRAKKIQFQDIHSQDKEPIFSIALTCGTKNGRNEILHEYLSPSQDQQKLALLDNTTNTFQKILSRHKNPKLCIDPKRLTFVNFKTKRSSQDSFFPTQAREKPQSQEKNRIKSEPRDPTSTMRRTGFPKELIQLKQLIKELPVVKQLRKKSSKPPKSQIKMNLSLLEKYNNSSFNQSMMQSMMHSNLDDFQETYERRVFRHCKSQEVRDYAEELKEVITYADEVMQEEVKETIQQEEAALQPDENDDASFKKQKIAIYRKYWPEYRRHTLNLRNGKDEPTFFSNFPQQADCELDESLQSLVSTIKLDFIRQEKLMNLEIVESEKSSIDKRFKYKINFQRQNYKRNVKSFLKCKKEYRIERKREQVRANGIIRMKKSNKMEKNFQPVVLSQDED